MQEEMAFAPETAFEQQAMVTALARAVLLYRLAAEHVAGGELAALLLEAAEARLVLAEAIAARTGASGTWSADDVALEDPRRAARSGSGSLRRMIDRAEAQIIAVIEDHTTGTLTYEETEAAKVMVSGMRIQIDALGPGVIRFRIPPAFRVDSSSHSGFGQNVYRVGFATTRAPESTSGTITDFTGIRGERAHYGFCDVVIPQSHRIGEVGSSWWRRIYAGDDRLHYDRPRTADPGALWAWMRERIGSDGANDALVFIHGYNVTFRDAALQTAQIGADLGFSGAMSFFSWPSRGRLLGYLKDSAAIEASEAAIAQFLVDVANHSGARQVHIIAHSMGNRGLLRAMNRILATAGGRSGKRFGQIILAAPDVDAEVFRDLANAYHALAQRTTLYVSPADLAVRASRLLNGANRIGFTPPVPVIPPIDTINVDKVDMTLLGHGYVASCDKVLADMHELLTRGSPPSQRFRLQSRTIPAEGEYWEFKP